VYRSLGEVYSNLHPPHLGGSKKLEVGGRIMVQAQILAKEKTALEEL